MLTRLDKTGKAQTELIMKTHVLLNSADNVVTALTELTTGDVLSIEHETGMQDVTLNDDIPYAHKFAFQPMSEGDPVIKYGEVIGLASQPIAPGDWVHVHNVESARARGDVG